MSASGQEEGLTKLHCGHKVSKPKRSRGQNGGDKSMSAIGTAHPSPESQPSSTD